MSDLVDAIDVSNFQPRDLTQIINDVNPSHVIVRLFLPEETPSQGHSLSQLHSAKANNCTTGGYFWLYNGMNPEDSVQDALELYKWANVGKIPVLWHDIEPYKYTIPTVREIREAVNYCDAQGVQPGLYIAKWVVDAYYPNGQLAEFGYLPHLLAYYDYDPDIDPQDLGYEYVLAGQQYADWPVDLDIMYKEFTEVKKEVMTPEEWEVIEGVIGPLRTWAQEAKVQADALERIGAGESWQFKNPHLRRREAELLDYASRLERLKPQ